MREKKFTTTLSIDEITPRLSGLDDFKIKESSAKAALGGIAARYSLNDELIARNM